MEKVMLPEVKSMWKAEYARQASNYTRIGLYTVLLGLDINLSIAICKRLPIGFSVVHLFLYGFLIGAYLCLAFSLFWLFVAFWPASYSYLPSAGSIHEYYDELKQYYSLPLAAVTPGTTLKDDFYTFLTRRYIESTDSLNEINNRRSDILFKAYWASCATMVLLVLSLLPFLVLRKGPAFVRAYTSIHREVHMAENDKPANQSSEPANTTPPLQSQASEKPVPPVNRFVREGGLHKPVPPINRVIKNSESEDHTTKINKKD